MGPKSTLQLSANFRAIMLLPIIMLGAISGYSQLAIQSFNSTYTAASNGTTYNANGAQGSPLASDSYTYRFGTNSGTTSNILNFSSFGIGSNTYAYRNIPTAFVKIRRNDNSIVSGTRQLLWYQATADGLSSTLNLRQSYQESMEIMFNGARGLNAGTDNIFNNSADGNGNNNNIERFDYIIPGGYTIVANSQEGFIVMDRGVLNAHDAFCVAGITALSGSQNPSSYTSALRLNSANYGSVNPIAIMSSVVMRKDPSDSKLEVSTTTDASQGIGGVFIRFADLGLPNGTVIYGYSVFPSDFPSGASASKIVDWQNEAYFPTNTEPGAGGLDMLAVSGVFQLSNALAPLANDVTKTVTCNVNGTGQVTVPSLSATDLNSGGTIASYTILKLPSVASGILYYHNGSSFVPVSTGQVLTVSQSTSLRFDPADGFMGDAVFEYLATNNFGLLSNTAYGTIPFSTMPVTSAGPNISVCNGSVTPLTATGATTYSWNPSLSLSCNNCSNPNFTASATRTYTITGTNLGTGCVNTATLTVSVNPLPTVSAGSNVSICLGSSTTLNATGGVSYSWIPATGLSCTTCASPVATPTTSTTYTVTGTNSFGCTSNATVTVSVNSLPSISAGSNVTRCAGVPAVLTGTGGVSYNWTANPTLSCTACTSTNATPTVTTTYTVTGTGANGCTNTATVTVSVNAFPSVSAGSGVAICTGGSTVLNATGAASYTWSPSTGLSCTNCASPTSTTTGTRTYTVTGTAANGCSASATVTVTVNPLPDVNAGTGGAICSGVGTTLNGTGASTYVWSPATGLSCTTCSNPVANPSSSTTYTLTGTSALGCVKTSTVTITVNSLPTVGVSSNTTICTGGSTPLAATGGVSYVWTPTAGLSCANCANPIATPASTITYTVTGTNANGCTNSASVTVSVNPSASLITGPTSLCNGSSISLSSTTAGGTWSSSNTAVATVTSGGGIVSSVSTGTVVISYVLPTGCFVTRTLTVNPSLSASATGTNAVCFGGNTGSINLTISGGTAPFTYSWSNGLNTQNISGLVAGTYTVTVTDSKGCSGSTTKTISQPAQLSLSATSNNVSCFGGSNGSIDLTVSGGTSPYTYLWNGGATTQDRTGLSMGTYTVTVTDANGCSGTTTRTITQPTALSAATTATNVNCNGGSNGTIDLTVTGGTSGYTYSWSNGATTQDLSGLTAGTYSVIVTDANSCTTTVSQIVTQPTTLSASTTSTNVNCNGGANGTIDLTVTGGTTPYSYSWNGGATTQDRTGLTAGTYSVTITDAKGCTTSTTRTITQPATLTATASSTNALCFGCANGTGSLSVAGGTTPYTYSWSNGATTQNVTGLVAATYSVTITDANGCNVVRTITITQPSVFAATVTGTNVSCSGGSNGTADLTVSGGTTPYTYSWSNAATTQDLSGLVAGTYSVLITDANGYTLTRSVTVTQPSVLAASATSTNVSCNGGNNGTIDVTVSGGTTPYTYLWNSGSTSQDRAGLVAGSYSVTITDANGCVTTTNRTITQPEVLSVSSTSINVSCNAGSNGSINVSVLGGTSPYTYLWLGGATTEDRTGLIAGTYIVSVTDANGCSASNTKIITQPTVLAASATSTNVNCNGGSNGTIDLTVTGGTTAYTYSWSNGATTQDLSGLAAGTYSVTVTDANGCTATVSRTITQPATLTATASSTNALCFGCANGTGSLSVSGGTTPYTYSWSNTATTQNLTGLVAGTYSVLITDAKGCTTTQTITITQPSVFAATVTNTNVNCNGGANGTADLTVSGGTTPYTYSWSNAATTQDLSGLVAGTYSVLITDANGYTLTRSVTVTQPSTLAASATSTNVNCNGGSNGTIDLTVTGGTTAYTYNWSNAATTQDLSGLAAGTYSVTVTDANGCTATASRTITQPATLTASSSSTNALCFGCANGTGSLSVAGGTTPYTYSWSNAATTQNVTGLVAGTYSVTITDAKGCTTTQTITITQPSVFAATVTNTNVSCNGGANGTADLTVSGGTTPYTYSWSNAATTQDLSGLVAGTYSVLITDANGYTLTRSVTVTQPAILAASATSTNVNCNGGSNGTIDLTVTGGTTAYTYSWSNGATTQDLSGLAAGTYSVTVTDAKGCTATASRTITQPATLTASSSSTNALCFGCANGTGSLSVAGGTTPYTYSWSNGATTQNVTALVAGTYSVLITDAKGCTTTQTITITQPSVFAATVTNTNVSCNGGSNGTADLTVSGGTTPYTYSWSNAATTQDLSGLVAGTYSVLITDANGYTLTRSVTVTQPATLAASATSTNVNCNGGSNGTIDLTVTGGTTPYTYSWSNGATTQDLSGLAAGTYDVTVTDANGCTATASRTITQPATLTSSATSTNALCFGCANGTGSLSVAGGTTPYTYSWSNGATTQNVTGLVAGTYSVLITDANGCTSTETISITEPSVFAATVTNTNVNCNGGANGTTDLTVSGGTTPYAYSWSNAATTQDLSGLVAGTYSVLITDANGYTLTKSVTVTQPATLAASATSTNVNCNGGANGTIDLTVTGGTTAYTYNWSNGASTQDLSGLAAGTYSVTVTDANGCTATASKTITQPATLTASSSSTNALCFGCANGTGSLSVAGGTTPYTYSWSNSATTQNVTGLVAGTYSVTITDAKGCTTTQTITITEPSEFTATVTNTNVNCNGGSNGTADLTVSGGTTPYTYSWSNAATTQDLSGLVAGTYSVLITDANGYTLTRSVTVTQPATLAASATSTNVNCNGGSNGTIDLTVTGGTTAYTYSWSNGATTQDLSGLAAGTYSVTVTDANGCTATASKTITQPATLTASSSSTNALCFGCANGTGSLSVAGGTTPYTYSWSNSATTQNVTGLVAGTYSVTITDANGCTTTQTITITEPSEFTATVTNTNVNCNGGSNGTADLTVSGGTAPYTYSWSNAATTQDLSGLVAGTYSVLITDANGYTLTKSVTVTEPVTLVASATSTNVNCNGGSNGTIDLTVTGGTTAYTYNWSNAATTQDLSGLAAGTYSVTVTDANGCTATASRTITQPATLTASSSSTNALCFGCANGTGSLSVSGGTTPYTYSWSNGATTQNVTALVAGTYSVLITDAKGCTTTQTITITQPSVFAATVTNTNVSCNGGANGTADLTVSGGTTPYTYSWSNAATTQDLSGLVAGTYNVLITDANGYTLTKSVTVTQPATLAASATSTNVNCNGGANGTIDLTVTGGTTAYTYSWSNGATTQDLSGLAAGTYSVTVTDANGCTATASKTITQPATLTASSSSTNALCFGCANGTGSLSVSGGTTPYTYSWSNGATTQNVTGLVAGTYSVLITDANGCTSTETIIITEPSVFAATVTNTNVNCNGGANGTADLTVSGGTTPYTYSWSNAATTQDLSGLVAGTYSVLITDANGYTLTRSVTVTQPATLAASATSTNVNCNGGANGTIDLTVTGGTTAYTYNWSNAATTQDLSGLAAGTYSVTVTDANGCTATASKTITQPATLTASSSSTNALCFGCANGTGSLSVAGGTTPYTYSWSNSATTQNVTGLVAGTYSVTITDAKGCTTTQTITITQPSVFAATVTNTNVSCNGGANGTADLTVSGGTTPYTYSWSNAATTQDLSGLVAGTYSVLITDANGYTLTRSVTVTQPATLAASATSTNVNCNGGSNGTIDLTVTGGTTAYTYNWSNAATTQDLSGLAAGTYSVTVTDANGCTATASKTITQPATLTASSSSTNALCFGCANGTGSLSVAGGTTPYTYSWSNSATTQNVTGLVAGTYSVTITDAKGCTTTQTITITQPSVFAATVTNTDVSCNGGANGTADLTVSGGTTPYTYSWSNAATTQDLSGLVAGTYSVLITDANGYTLTRSVTVTQPATLAASATSTNVNCNGGSNGTIDLTVTGGTTAYTYNWSNAATTQDLSGLAAGTYSVTVTDANGCTATASRTITQAATLTASSSSTNALCFGCANGTGSLSVAGGTTPYTYSWSNAATTQNVTGLVAGTYSVTITDANGCTTTQTITITEPSEFTATVTNTNVNCNGGSNGTADLTVSGGTTPYTYSWSNAATTQDLSGLVAGTYSVLITDANGYTLTRSVTVTQPATLAASATSTNVNCNGGSNGTIDLTVTGGTTAYTYNWSNAATTQDLSGLAAGTYSVTVTDANGCTATASRTITQPATLTASSSSTNALCFGCANGTGSLSVAGGTTPYTYSWSNAATTQNVTGLVAGTYSVTITDANGCTTTQTITITEPSLFAATVTNTNVNCNGGSNGTADLTVSGGTTPYTYSWSNAATTQDLSGLVAGTYSVLITDANGYTLTKSVTVTQPATLAASATSTNVNCNGGSNGTIDLTVTGGTTAYTYNWSNAATTQDLSGLAAGTYSVTVTDANGCTATASRTITQPATLTASSSSTNALCFGCANGTGSLSVAGGTTPYTYSWSNSATTQNVTGLVAGTYSVTITDAKGCTTTQTITITQPSVFVATVTNTNINCNGGANGTADLTVSGGTTPYTYSWSNAATTQDLSGLVAGTYSVLITDANGYTLTRSVTVTQPATLAASATSTNVNCNGGSNGTIDLTVTGGTTAYTYNWSNAATTQDLSGLAAGTYSVTVTDANGCTATASRTITQPATLAASSSSTNALCFGCANGTSSLSVSGGTTPYTYSWSNAATTQNVTGLVAGTYSVTITDANGCTTTQTITITQPSVFAATVTNTNVNCNGGANGTADLTVSGGTTPYTYSWSNAATTQDLSGLVAGTYSVLITDANGYTLTRSVAVTQPATLAASATSTNVNCNGGSNGTIDLTVTGGTTAYTYNWSNAATTQDLSGLAAGTYIVTVTDANGCTATASRTITQPATLIFAGTPTDVACYGASTGAVSTTTTGGTTPYSYSWSNGATTANLTGVVAGTYSVTVTDAKGCAASQTFDINQSESTIVTATGTALVCAGNTTTLYATPTGGSWSSSNVAKATVNATSGVVSGISAGSVNITYTALTGCRAIVPVTVNSTVPNFIGTLNACVGETVTLSNSITGGVWTLANPSIATINSATGVVTGIMPGTTTVTYTLGEGCSKTATFTVKPTLDPISGSGNICLGQSVLLTNCPGGVWTSSNTAVASISGYGTINGLSLGTAIITFRLTSTNCFVTRAVTVNPRPSEVASISAICPDQTAILTSTPAGGTWSSSNSLVVAVNPTSGVVTGVINNYTGISVAVITYTLPTGCSRSTVVTVNPVPAPIYGGSTTLCIGGTTIMSSGSTACGWSSTNPAVASISSTGVVTANSTGTTTISFTNASGCAATSVVTVNGVMAPSIGTDIVCTGQTTTLSNATPGGTWSTSNSLRATVNTLTGVVTGVSAGTVNITYRIGTSCYTVTQVTVNSNASIISGLKTVCVGTTSNLTYPTSGGSWTSSNASVASVNLSSGVVSGVSTGTATITYTISAGCFQTAIVTVTASPAAITGVATMCVGATSNLYNTGGTWSSANTSIATVNSSGVVAGISGGTTTISYRINATGCHATRVVTVIALPAVIANPSAICFGTSTTLTTTPTGGTWISSNSTVVSIDATTGVATANLASATGISLAVITYTAPSGCKRTTVVTVSPQPSAILGGTSSLCVAGTTSFSSSSAGCSWSSSNPSVATIAFGGYVTAVSPGTAVISFTNTVGCASTRVVTVNATAAPNTGNTTICIAQTSALANPTSGGTWSSSNTLKATVSSAGVVTGVSAGTANITYALPGGCNSVSTITILDNTAAISGDASACVGTPVTYSYPVSGGTWSSSNTTIASVNATTGVVTGVTTGSAVITYTLVSGCHKTKIINITVLSTPITGPSVVCAGSSITFANTTSGGVWSSANTAIATVNPATGAVTGVAVGSTVITYTTGGGCYAVRTVSVIATPAPITGITIICMGQTTTLHSTTHGGVWSAGGSSVVSICATCSSGVITGIAEGVATITYTVGSGCSTTTVVTVAPMPTEISGSLTLCAGAVSGLTAGTYGTWSSTNTAVATISSTTGLLTAVSEGTATISFVTPSGCMRTAVVTVSPLTTVAPISGNTGAICSGGTLSLYSSTSGGTWSTSNAAVATVGTSGAVVAVSSGTAKITYTVGGVCGSAIATSIVTVSPTPDAGVISGSTNLCVGSIIPLTSTMPGGIWSDGSPFIAVTCPCNSGQVTGIAPGVATLSYTVSNACGTSVATYTVTVNEIPVITPSVIAPVIAGHGDATMHFSTTGTPVTYSIVWSTAADAVGFTNITGATLTSSPLTIAVPLTAVEGSFAGNIIVSNGYCASLPQPFSITVNESVNIYTFAGTGISGYTGNNGAATLAKMTHPYNIATDCDGNAYIGDFENAVVRKVSPTGVITTIAGNGVIGYSGDGGPATAATMSHPYGVALDAAGNLYFSDFNNHAVRRVSTSGVITRIAGNGAYGYSGDGGAATAASLQYPAGLTVDGAGNLYIADDGNSVIRKVSPSGVITTVAGTGIPGYTGDGAAATAARLSAPKGVHADGTGNLYITDYNNQVVRKVDAAGIITTIAGNGVTGYSGDGGPATAAQLNRPVGVTTDNSGNVYFTEQNNYLVRKVNAAGVISTVAGNHTPGYSGDGGPALLAQLSQPMGLSRNCNGNIFIADNANYAIRILGEYNRKPYFVNGNVQNVDVCTGAESIEMNARLSVIDYDTMQPLTWTVVTAPAHGTLVAGYSASSTGSQINPTGLSYSPAVGYTGADVFVVQVSDGIATAVTTINVTVSVPPVAGIITGATAICGSGVTHLFASVPGGVWSSADTSIATINSGGYVIGVGYGTALISYTVTNACGTDVATTTVTYNALPFAGTVIGAAKVCMGSTLIYTGTVPGGVWSSGNTSIATVTSGGIVYGVTPGLATISYAVTNSCGTAYGLRDVTVEILPVTSPIAGASGICAGASVTLTNATPGGAWYSSNTPIATIDIETGVVTGVAEGVVTLSYVHNTSCGVVYSTRTFTVAPATLTMPAIAGPATACVGSTITLTNSLTGGVWSSSSYPTVLTIGSTSGVVTGITTGTATVTYAVSHTCGTSYATRVVTVNPLPVVTPILATMSICPGWTITAANATSGGVWSSSNPALATVSATGVITGVASGMPVISYSVTNMCGTATATALVPVGAPPAATPITGASDVCVASSITLSNVTAGGTWYTPNITIASVSSAGIVTGVGAGTAIVSYTTHNGCGYTNVTKVITVNPIPVVAGTTGLSNVCTGSSITLANPTSGGAWSSSNTAIATVGSTGVVTGVAPGTVTISYSITNGCGTVAATKVINVQVMFATIYGSLATSPSAHDGCALLTVVGGVAPYTYLWSNGATTQNLTGLAIGDYSVLVTDSNGDTATAHVHISYIGARGAVASDVVAEVMHGAHPNPFVTTSIIRFNLPVSGTAIIDVFSAATGAKVATIFNDHVNAGEEYTATINGADIPSGMYIYRIATEGNAYIGKVLLVK